MRKLISFILLNFIPLVILAQGRILIPEPPPDFGTNQVYLKAVDAQIDIKSGIAKITLEQIFYNDCPRQLEGEYLFPIPDDAQIHDFYLYINGQKVKGQVLDSDKARRTYINIVRSMRDPALLEYTGYGLFKARIFPILPKKERKIEMAYTQVLSGESGTYKLTIPIRQSGQGAIKTYHLKINIQGSSIANIYSPSHDIDINRHNNERVTVSFEANDLEGQKDFILYYSEDRQAVNGTLLSFRPRTDRDGYFMFIAAPSARRIQQKPVAKDFIFVMDKSGSMQGEKMEQARKALRFCVNALNSEDRFEIITFSSSIDNFSGSLNTANSGAIENARYFIDNLSASGGTNIDAALKKAFVMKLTADSRSTNIIFLTDGLPTEGEQDIGSILRNIQHYNKDFIHIFSFGVGFDVNTFLLDRLSRDSHGTTHYVKPGENIEREVSALFARISNPVLTDPRINFGDLPVYDVFPQKPPDLFKGQRLLLFGRYRGPAESGMRLSGVQGTRRLHFDYDGQLAERERGNDFIAHLWANRKVSHLLEQIRFNGENEELVQSVKALGKEYGIVTPYTAYLVKEQEENLAALPAMGGGITAKRLQSAQSARQQQAAEDSESAASEEFLTQLGY